VSLTPEGPSTYLHIARNLISKGPVSKAALYGELVSLLFEIHLNEAFQFFARTLDLK
jgi:hypothetical protein